MIDHGDVGGQDLTYKIDYQTITDPFDSRFTLTRAKTATALSGAVLRERSATFGPRGEMKTLTDLRRGGKDPVTGAALTGALGTNPTSTFTYTANGSLESYTDPSGYSLTYTYDPIIATHIRTITDIFGYVSTRTYELGYGLLTDTVDINGIASP